MPPALDVIRGTLEPGPDPIEALQALLRRYPQASAAIGRTRIEVQPLDTSGFPVCLEIVPAGFVLRCGAWHRTLRNAKDAIDLTTIALSRAGRLRLTLRSGVATRWELQRQVPGGHWAGLGVQGGWLVPFWGRYEVRYLQNPLLEAA